jgi:hypothetical protein
MSRAQATAKPAAAAVNAYQQRKAQGDDNEACLLDAKKVATRVGLQTQRRSGIPWRKIGAFLFGIGLLGTPAVKDWSRAVLDGLIFFAFAWPYLPTIHVEARA